MAGAPTGTLDLPLDLVFSEHDVVELKASDDPGGFRTRDLRIKSPLLYQLSYRVANRRTRSI